MTPIQKVVIPFLLQGKDVMACSETGTGKTVAYLFPIISNLIKEKVQSFSFSSSEQSNEKVYPSTMILVPSRELGDQIAKESKKLCYLTGLKTVAIYGGTRYDKQQMELSKGCDILVGTPGRITDYLRKEKINLSQIKTIIIDEADKMLDMGFEPQLSVIINDFQILAKDKRQNIMFSATFNSQVEQIAKKFLNDYYKIRPSNVVPKKIIQELILAEDSEKNDKLCQCLQKINSAVIIFLETKRGVDSLKELLESKEYSVLSIHGDKSQYDRENAIKDFSKGSNQILIATDVASRGIDFQNVQYIINYDLPKHIDDYIHRIGRTGRMGQEGNAISFINSSNSSIFNKLYLFMKSQNQVIPKWFFTMNLNHQKGQENQSRSNRFNSNNKYHCYKDGYNNEKSFNKNKNSYDRSRSSNNRPFKKHY